MGHKSRKSKAPKIQAARSQIQTGLAPLPAIGYYPEAQYLYTRREELQFRIATDCKAHILLEGNVTQEAIRKLITYLEMSLKDFAEEVKDSTTQA